MVAFDGPVAVWYNALKAVVMMEAEHRLGSCWKWQTRAVGTLRVIANAAAVLLIALTDERRKIL